MKRFFLILSLVFFVLPTVRALAADPVSKPPTTNGGAAVPPTGGAKPTGRLDTPADAEEEKADIARKQASDLALLKKDRKNVAKMRADLESEFLGALPVTDAQYKPIKDYINWLMAPFESLVSPGKMPDSLNMKQVRGPTGTAKTAIPKRLFQMAVDYNLADDTRYDYKQGDKDTVMQLSSVLKFGQKELVDASDKTSYAAKRARHKQTWALVIFDEATMYKKLPKNQEEMEREFQRDLRELQRKAKAKIREITLREKMAEKYPHPGEPPAPVPAEAAQTLRDAYKKKLAEYNDKMAIYYRKQGIPDVEEDLRKQTEKLVATYVDLGNERNALNRDIMKIWQAASGGKVFETIPGEQVGPVRKKLEDIWKRQNDFKASYKQTPLLEKYDKLEQAVQLATSKAAQHATIMQAMNVQAGLVAADHDFLSKVSAKAIDEWLKSHDMLNGKALKAQHASGEWIADMIADLRESNAVTSDVPGVKPAQLKGTALAEEIRTRGTQNLTTEKEKITADIFAKGKEIDLLRKDRDAAEKERAAYVEAAKHSATTYNGVTAEALLAKHIALQKEYHEVIVEALDTQPGLIAVSNFVNALSADASGREENSLKVRYPEYYKIVDGNAGNRDRYVAEYLSALKAASTPQIKFNEMLLMNPEHAREAVYKAVTADASSHEDKEKTKHLENVHVLWSFNDLGLEKAVLERVEAKKKKGEKVTIDDMHKFYVEESAKHPEWAMDFWRDYFGNLIEDALGTNPLAARRRLLGAEGELDMVPMTTAQAKNSASGTLKHMMKLAEENSQANGIDAHFELFLDPKVVDVFVHGDLNAELGPNNMLTPVRNAVNNLMTQLNLIVDDIHTREGGSVNMKVALMYEHVDHGPDRLVLRRLDHENVPDRNVLWDLSKVKFPKDSFLAATEHSFKLAPATTKTKVKQKDPVSGAETEVEVETPAAGPEFTQVVKPKTLEELRKEVAQLTQEIEDKKRRAAADRDATLLKQANEDQQRRDALEAEIKTKRQELEDEGAARRAAVTAEIEDMRRRAKATLEGEKMNELEQAKYDIDVELKKIKHSIWSGWSGGPTLEDYKKMMQKHPTLAVRVLLAEHIMDRVRKGKARIEDYYMWLSQMMEGKQGDKETRDALMAILRNPENQKVIRDKSNGPVVEAFADIVSNLDFGEEMRKALGKQGTLGQIGRKACIWASVPKRMR